MQLVLASSSPRRRHLLEEAGVRVRVEPPHGVDETPLPGERAVDLVQRLAMSKCQAVAAEYLGCWVLGADTVVHFAGELLGKPADLEAARALLRRLSGRTHEVMTGVCIACLEADLQACWCSTSQVTFRELTEPDIDRAMALTNPLDKAGGYAIQEQEQILVASYTGLHSTIVGLPIEEVLERWARLRQRRRNG